MTDFLSEDDITVTLLGTQGPAGVGRPILSGSGAPDDTDDGINGDFYIDTDVYEIYGPKTAGVWGSGTDLIGAGVSDHGALTGLTDDDHSIYALADGTRGTFRRPSIVIDSVEGASAPWDLDGIVDGYVWLTTVDEVTMTDAADVDEGGIIRFRNGSGSVMSLTINAAGSDEFTGGTSSVNPTVPSGGFVAVTRIPTATGFEWAWNYEQAGEGVNLDTTNFDGLLSASETEVQAALDVLDDITASDISVGTLDGNLVGVSGGTVEDAVQAVDDLSLGGGGDAISAYSMGSGGGMGLPAFGIDSHSVSTRTWVANRLLWFPFYAPGAFTPTGIIAYVSSAAAAGKILRAGLFRWNPTAGSYGEPSALVEDGGTVTCDSTGTKTVVISPGEQAAGWYSICVGSDGTPGIYSYEPGAAWPGRWGFNGPSLRMPNQWYKNDATQVASGFDDPASITGHTTDPNARYGAFLEFS